jgi:hypothetical protein
MVERQNVLSKTNKKCIQGSPLDLQYSGNPHLAANTELPWQKLDSVKISRHHTMPVLKF